MVRNTKHRTRKQCLQEKAKLAGIIGWERLTEAQLKEELRRIGANIDLRKYNSAPKRVVFESVAEKMRQHALEPVVVNKRKVERVIAMLEMLSDRALKKRDVGAAREYLDRTIGKPRAHDRVDVGIAAPDLTLEDEEQLRRVVRILRGV